MQTSSTAAPAQKTNKTGTSYNPFLPSFMAKADTIRWLKRIHAWTGFWGALAFLLLGISGFLLSHRSVVKIDTGAAKEVSSVVLQVSPDEIKTLDDLGRWASETFKTDIKARPRRSPSSGQAERVLFLGQEVAASAIWRQRLYAPDAYVIVEYVPGSTSVKATKSAQNAWGVIKNLHKGAGMGIAWVLFLDTMAGALIAMTLTGFLLWSKLHGTRLAAGGIVLTSFGVALFASFPRFLF